MRHQSKYFRKNKKYKYGNCPNILYINFSDKMACVNNADTNQTAPEGESDQSLCCLPFHQIICKTNS